MSLETVLCMRFAFVLHLSDTGRRYRIGHRGGGALRASSAAKSKTSKTGDFHASKRRICKQWLWRAAGGNPPPRRPAWPFQRAGWGRRASLTERVGQRTPGGKLAKQQFFSVGG